MPTSPGGRNRSRAKMKSTQIRKDELVSTVLVEGNTFRYYEIATWDKRERKWVIRHSHIEFEDDALRLHDEVLSEILRKG